MQLCYQTQPTSQQWTGNRVGGGGGGGGRAVSRNPAGTQLCPPQSSPFPPIHNHTYLLQHTHIHTYTHRLALPRNGLVECKTYQKYNGQVKTGQWDPLILRASNPSASVFFVKISVILAHRRYCACAAPPLCTIAQVQPHPHADY